MHVSDFDYDLPKDLIAQYPAEDRSSSRLLIYNRAKSEITHDVFRNIGKYLIKGDVLVLNDTRVIPCKIEGRKKTGGKVEILIFERVSENTYRCLVRNAGKSKRVEVSVEDMEVILEKEDSQWFLRFEDGEDRIRRLLSYGKPPLPPYIKRPATRSDLERYQTVFARVNGSIAAPTAGLHFTEALLEELKEKGVEILFITLHVGIGTFFPVKAEKVEDHRMEREFYRVDSEVSERIRYAKSQKRRVIACGTTVVRTLETVFSSPDAPLEGYTDLFIYPGYDFKVVDGLITNFHLPKSTPLILVSAFVGWENLLKCYREAIEKRYRFLSYGDAMLIL